ncbi:MAG TPA: hypothetical protein VFK79_04445 [Xanthobacteraceae bacterium]|nr:hypothetical protein [Xanthobacteraceae bacterium]
MTGLSPRSVALFAAGLALITCEAGTALAQGSGFPPPRFVHFKDQTQGALYMPDPAVYPNPTTAMIAVHRVNNRMHDDGISPLIDREMPKRGVIVLGLNTHSVNNEAAVDWEGQMPKDIKAAVEYLKKEVGAKTVVLLGGSGGGPNVAFYQALAEKGLSVCKGTNKIVECADDPGLLGPPADAIVFRDTHPGNPMNRLRSANPAVLNEADAGTLDDSLNPFLEKNGYNPKGCSTFSAEFQKRYFEGQSARMNRLVDQALKMKAEMAAGKHFPVDDAPFVAHRNGARLVQLDRTVDAKTDKPRKLVKDDGSIVTDIVTTVRPCVPRIKDADATYAESIDVTVKSFLGAGAIRSKNAMTDIDHCSSNNSTTCMVQYITVPTLVLAAQGHYFIRDNEEIYEKSASRAKDFAVIAGATHGMGNCSRCEGAPYKNARTHFYDYIAKWLNTGYAPVSALK